MFKTLFLSLVFIFIVSVALAADVTLKWEPLVKIEHYHLGHDKILSAAVKGEKDA